MPKSIILSYDKSIDKLEKKDFREVIAAFLLEQEPQCNPSSSTQSTIIFESNKHDPVDEWTELLKIKFKEGFYFVTAEIATDNRLNRAIRNSNSNKELEASFIDIVKNIQKD